MIEDFEEGNNDCPCCGGVIIVYKGEIVNIIDHMSCIAYLNDED